jgi:hypothetical protein
MTEGYFAGMLLLIAAGGLYAISSFSSPTAKTGPGAQPVAWSQQAGSQTGCSAAKRAVLAQLKAPSTAKFESCDSTPVNPQTVLVSVTVDAQNSFGAMLRNRYLVRVTEGGTAQVEGTLR